MRVHGVDGLRVVDASSMPYVTNGNIYAPVMMLAEKAADLILGQHPAAAARRAVLPLPRRHAAVPAGRSAQLDQSRSTPERRQPMTQLSRPTRSTTTRSRPRRPSR